MMSEMNQGMNPCMNPRMNPDTAPAMGREAAYDMAAPMNQGMAPNMRQGMAPPMNQRMVPPMNQGMVAPMNQGMAAPMNQGMVAPMNQGMGCGMNPGMGCGQTAQSKSQLMKQINEASFAMDDVTLFLDTHPDNMEALQYYKNVAAMRRNAMAAYQQQYGPLMIDQVTGNGWTWETEIWPWEGGC